MLTELPDAEAPSIAVVVEDDDLLGEGQKLLAGLRRAKISAELIASGSVKKRFDKAVKLNVFGAIAINANLLVDGEIAKLRLREPRPGFGLGADLQLKITEVIADLFDLSGQANDIAYGREVGLRRKPAV
jgi:hypothetical protein